MVFLFKTDEDILKWIYKLYKEVDRKEDLLLYNFKVSEKFLLT